MLITSHLLATLLLADALALPSPEIYPAIIGGVGVDLDHLFVNDKWKSDLKNFINRKEIDSGVNQHSHLQELVFGSFFAVAIGLIIHSCIPSIRWWILPGFVLLHIFLDALMKFDHWPFAPLSNLKYQGFLNAGTKLEIILSSLLLLIYLSIRHII